VTSQQTWRRFGGNTSFLAGVLLVYLAIVALAFVLAIVSNVVVTRS